MLRVWKVGISDLRERILILNGMRDGKNISWGEFGIGEDLIEFKLFSERFRLLFYVKGMTICNLVNIKSDNILHFLLTLEEIRYRVHDILLWNVSLIR